MQSVIENSGNKINNMIYKKKKLQRLQFKTYKHRDCSSRLPSTKTTHLCFMPSKYNSPNYVICIPKTASLHQHKDMIQITTKQETGESFLLSKN